MVRKRGFTIVEVLVVVAILAVLIAMLLPSLWNARSRTKQVLCMSNLRGIGTALMLYAQNNEDSFPYVGEVRNYDPKNMPRTPEQMLGNALNNEWSLLKCPSDRNPERLDWFVWRSDRNTPAPWKNAPLEVSYMWSEQVLRGLPPAYMPIPYSRAYHPSRWGILSEGWHIFNAWDWRTLLPDFEDSRLDQNHGSGTAARVNMLFGDFHVELESCSKDSLRKVRSSPLRLSGNDD